MEGFQTTLVILSAIGALLYLFRKPLFKKKKKKENNCGVDCGCH
jgi:hypothetical protein